MVIIENYPPIQYGYHFLVSEGEGVMYEHTYEYVSGEGRIFS